MTYSKLANIVDYSWHHEGVNMETGRNGHTIQYIILHHNASTNFDAVPQVWVSRPAGAHYQVGTNADGIKNTLAEEDTGYHAANYLINEESIGIENVDATGSPTWTIDPETVENCAKLVADICGRYSIPIDRAHIRKHSEVSLTGTACPCNLPVDAIVARAVAIAGGATTTNTTTTTSVSTPATISQGSILVRVDKAQAAVRSAPNTSASLAGSQILVQGDEFYAIGTVSGESTQGNNGIWYKSQYGNYVSSNGLTVVSGATTTNTTTTTPSNHGVGRYYVSGTNGEGLRARAQPNTTSAVVNTSYGSVIPEGSPVDVVRIVQGESINGNTNWAQSVSGAYESMAYLK